MANTGNETDERSLKADIGISTANLVLKLNQLYEAQTQLKKVSQYSTDVISNRSNVSFLKDRWNDIVGLVKEKTCSQTSRILNSVECLSSQDATIILEEMKQAQLEISEGIIFLGGIASAAIILLQVWRLKEVWAVVKDAKNVLEESKGKVDQINQKLDFLSAICAELKKLIVQHENTLTSEEEKKTLMRAIRLKLGRSNSSFVEIRCMISEVKVLVDGKKQVLVVYKNEQLANGIMNSVHFGTNLIQCFQFGGILGTGLKIMQYIITATFFGLAVSNFRMHNITAETLVKIRENLEIIDKLEIRLNGFLNDIHTCEDWVAINDQ